MSIEQPQQLQPSQLIETLSDFSLSKRLHALRELARRVEHGEIPIPRSIEAVNLHYHTFFSFNAEGWSPCRILWEAFRQGLQVAGTVDFDVLHALPEVLEAGEILGMPTISGIESRVFIPALADHEINSPQEPGIAYFQGMACYRLPDPDTPEHNTLEHLALIARQRTEVLLTKVNDFLEQVQLDFQQDVLPLTPAGNTTERHLLAAYDIKTRQVFPHPDQIAQFWSTKLGLELSAVEPLLSDSNKLRDTIRSRLMKSGGVGYVVPDAGSFPTIQTMVAMIKGIGAIPTYAWLDGTSSGEADPHQLLEYMRSEGVMAVNIIPDRNWNIADPDTKTAKVDKLQQFIHAAQQLEFPVAVGTEMNKAGLPFVDNFDAPELAPYRKVFLDGARFFYGCSATARYAGIDYWHPAVEAEFQSNHALRQKFFAELGNYPLFQHKFQDIMKQNFGEWTPSQLVHALAQIA